MGAARHGGNWMDMPVQLMGAAHQGLLAGLHCPHTDENAAGGR